MPNSKPIHQLAKELGTTSSDIIKICASLGIEAKASAKRLNTIEEAKVLDKFNASKQIINVKPISVVSQKTKPIKKTTKNTPRDKQIKRYFRNRLIKD
tara:strand:- start:6040 stop:6333 length:294 start_codon:yes stop_codon:yes gene_type:complete